MVRRRAGAAETPILTILCSDIVASTELYARLGDDAAHEVVDAHDALARQVITEFGGRRVKGLGDGVLAVFGSPRAALLAAVQLQERTAVLDAAPGVRVGLSAGEVVQDVEGDVHGAAVSACARITALATGGQTLASEVVIRLAGTTPGVTARRVGDFGLKGFDEPAVLWEVAASAAPTATPPTTAPPAATDFVGRSDERRQLMSAVQEATQGRGEVVLVVGEAGMGKTRLAREVARDAASARCTTVWAACWEGEDAAPYWPWSQIVQRLLRQVDLADGRLDVAVLNTLIEAGDGRAERPAGGDERAARARLYAAVVELVSQAADSGPLLVVIDDLHWADEPSLLLLHHLSVHLPMLRAAIVGTYRSGDVADARPLGRRVPEMLRWTRTVRLAGLRDDEVAGLVAAFMGTAPTESGLAAITARTGGNPLLVRELAQLVGGTSGGAGTATLLDTAVPSSIRAILGGRLATVSGGCRQLLDTASVLGGSFDVEALSEVSGDGPGVVLSHVDEALGARILQHDDDDRYCFAHGLFRDALTGELGETRRMELHLRCGEALERLRDGGRRVEPAELARHFTASSTLGGWGRAGRYSTQAGERALAAFAYEDARRHYEHALQCLDRAGDGDGHRGELCVSLAIAASAAGDHGAARRSALEAAALARSSGSADLLARAALCTTIDPGGFEVTVADAEQINVLREALAALPPTATALRAMTLGRLSVALSFSAPVDERRPLAEQAVAMARAGGDRAVIAASLAAYCDTIAGPDGVTERLALSTEIRDLAATGRDLHRQLLALRLQVVARLEAGDILGAGTAIDAYATVAAQLRRPVYDWLVPMWRGMQARAKGDLDACERATEDADAIGREGGSTNAGLMCGVQRWLLHIARADGNSALATFERLVGDLSQLGGALRIPLALTLAASGRTAEARAELDVISTDLLAAMPLDSEWLPFLAELTEAIDRVGGHPLAEWAYRSLLPYRGLFIVEGMGAVLLGSVEHYLGVLAVHLGLGDEAASHFAAALVAHRRAGPMLVQQTELAEGTMLGAAPRSVEPKTPAAEPHARLVPDGDDWTATFEGRTARLRDVKGLRDLARLIAQQGTEVHVLDLAAPDPQRPRSGDAGAVIDSRARDAYRARLAQLEADIDEADRFGDMGRADAARAERDALIDQLAAAYGLRGRARRAASDTERARSTVTRRIHDALRRIEDAHPELGRHLRRSVRTGTYCVYEPDRPIEWALPPPTSRP